MGMFDFLPGNHSLLGVNERPAGGFTEHGRDSAGAPAKCGSVVQLKKSPSDKNPYGSTVEYPSFTCRHCGLPATVKPGMLDKMAWNCPCCGGLVCPFCAAMGDCTDTGEFMKRVEASERAWRLHQAAGADRIR